MFPVISVSDGFSIPTYILINSIAFCLGVVWIYRRTSLFDLPREAVLDVTLAGMIGGFLGARIFHIVFEHPKFYLSHPDFIYKIWYGGFVFYGGLLGGSLAVILFCRFRKVPVLYCADLFAPVLALGYTIGRFGCFAAGCCYGRPTSLPWAVHFPEGVEAPALVGLHPTQLYSSFWSFVTLMILLRVERQHKHLTKPGQMFGLWLALQSVGRLVVEQFRDDFRGPKVFNLSISTWLSMVAFSIALLLISRKKENDNASTPVSNRNS